ncbi:MAG: hypothetical protein K6G38_03485 [Gammaproteobacteria bacterium]|nr:hypothetical protein [Gammaproteobacteria bacterium]
MKLRIKKGVLNGKTAVPPSKSYAHRHLIASALSYGGIVKNIEYSDDIIATLTSLKSLGFNYIKRFDSVEFLADRNRKESPVLDANESGSTLRFLIPLSLVLYDNVTFLASKKLLERGISLYEELFKNIAIEVIKEEDRLIFKGKLKGGNYKLRGDISSQYFSGLLFALPLLDIDSTIEITTNLESQSYLDITIDVLRRHGIDIKYEKNLIEIPGRQRYLTCDSYTEGDMSNMANIDAFNYLGSDVILTGFKENSLQGDKIYREYFEILKDRNATLDISNCIDLGPILFSFASLNHGATFTGTNRLKLKESDRALSMKEELSKAGINVEILDDIVKVSSNPSFKPLYKFNSHNDHRIVMALALYSSISDVVIDGCEAVNKSFPSYFSLLKRLGMEVINE